MKIVIAADSFKGSCSSLRMAELAEQGIKKIFPAAEVVKVPVADGGEGTTEALVSGLGGTFRRLTVTGPLGTKVTAEYGILPGKVAVMEMATASGLPLVAEADRNPALTTTYGTGEMIKDALDQGCRKLMLGIGGSVTNDGGMGMAQALGVSFQDAAGQELGFGGGVLAKLAKIDLVALDPRLKETELITLCDVANPLCGPQGASYIYGPQKGAKPEDLPVLDRNLRHFAAQVKLHLGKDIAEIPGAGAAGGLGAGMIAFCDSKLRRGIDTILELVELESKLVEADLVITGEGRIDGQSIYGKVPVGVGLLARKHQIPVIAIVGGIGPGAEAVYEQGIDSIVSIVNRPMALAEAIQEVEPLIVEAAERLMRIIRSVNVKNSLQ
jgi:glycerate kinase